MNEVRPTFLCGGDFRLVVDGQDCPQAELHEPSPAGYIDWFEWATRQGNAGRLQKRCPGCGLYRVWTPGRSAR